MHRENATSIVAERPDLDWAYVEHRARVGPKRVLALLVYASSCGLAGPEATIGRREAAAFPA
jgi:hypothetical protein